MSGQKYIYANMNMSKPNPDKTRDNEINLEN